MSSPLHCPCGLPHSYEECCGRYTIGNLPAPTAEALMRSRYSAYTLAQEPYLLATWHPSTRPAALDLNTGPRPKWLGLQVKRHQQTDDSHAEVEFIARYKIGSRAYRLHETSRFVREEGQWYYLDGDIKES
jgi:SEC-C motif-containing protein